MEFLGGTSFLLILVIAIIYMDEIIEFFAGLFSIAGFFKDEENDNDNNDSLRSINDSV